MRILELHAPYFRSAWRREHEVLCWGVDARCDLRAPEAVVTLDEVLARLPAGWTPDFILLGDDSRGLLVVGLEHAPCPTVMVSVDTHHHAWWHAELAAVHDVAFTAQRDLLPAFTVAAAHTTWLPLWAPDDVEGSAIERSLAATFVGTLDPARHPERRPFLDAVAAAAPLQVVQGEWRALYGASRIVLNQTVRGDLNFRVFEAMAGGALLVTEAIGNGLFDLFAEGRELVSYPRGDADAAAGTIRHYLADERARRLIAETGRAAVRAAHCESHRAAVVLEAVRRVSPRPMAGRIAAAARTYALLGYRARWAANAFGNMPAFRAQRERYLEAAVALAAHPDLGEPHTSAVLGMVAGEIGDLDEAEANLSRAVRFGAPPQDHLLRASLRVSAGDLRGARGALETLRDAHPAYDLTETWIEALGVVR